MSLTRDQIRALFPMGTPLAFGGLVYAAPTKEWVFGPFYQAFKAELWDENLGTWAVRFQCRDFTRTFASDAQKANALTTSSSLADALAVGEFWFHPDKNPPGEDHAIASVVYDDGTLRLCFIDPQNGLEWIMSTTELLSCTYARF